MAETAWGSMTWLIDEANQPGARLSLAHMTVNPGALSPAHRHDNANEAIYVIAGRMVERVDDDWIEADEGETVFVPAGAIHQTRCLGNTPVALVIAYSSGTRHYEEVNIE